MLKDFKFSYIASAKINIFLKIISKNKNFHNLVSLVGFTEFGDKLSFSQSKEDIVLFTGPFSKNLNPKDNSILKAKFLLQKKGFCNFPVKIKVQKNIPVGGGLGGGSADAACFLNAMKKVSPIVIPENIIKKTAQEVGSDVPVCLEKKWSLITGRGTTVENISSLKSNNLFCVLVSPKKGISTKFIFSKVKNFSSINFNNINELLIDNKIRSLFEIGNDLQDIVRVTNNDVKNILDDFKIFKSKYRDEIIGFSMSGSGSTCYIVCNKFEIAKKVNNYFKKLNFWTVITKFV